MRGRRGAAGTLAVLVLAAGCGLPRDGGASTIPAEEVPYGLLHAKDAEPDHDRGRPTTDASPMLFWADESGMLVPVRSKPTDGGPYQEVVALLAALEQGPGSVERAAGLSTALAPDTRMELSEISGTTAVIALDVGEQQLDAGRLPLGVGQVVLTVTSVRDIDRVLLADDSGSLEVPLPGGALTSGLLGARSYLSLVRPSELSSSNARGERGR